MNRHVLKIFSKSSFLLMTILTTVDFKNIFNMRQLSINAIKDITRKCLENRIRMCYKSQCLGTENTHYTVEGEIYGQMS